MELVRLRGWNWKWKTKLGAAKEVKRKIGGIELLLMVVGGKKWEMVRDAFWREKITFSYIPIMLPLKTITCQAYGLNKTFWSILDLFGTFMKLLFLYRLTKNSFYRIVSMLKLQDLFCIKPQERRKNSMFSLPDTD